MLLKKAINLIPISLHNIKVQSPLLATRSVIMAVEINQSVGSAAQEHFTGSSATSYLDVEQTIVDGNYSPSLAITAVVAPEVNKAIISAAQKNFTGISAAVDKDVVQPIANAM